MVAQIRRPEADLKPEMLLFNDNQTNGVGWTRLLRLIFCPDFFSKTGFDQCS